MVAHSLTLLALAAGYAAAFPAPQVSGYTDADAPYATITPAPVTVIPSTFGPDSQVEATSTDGPPPAPRVTSDPTGLTSHGPFDGTPTTIGAVSTTVLGATIPDLGPAPTATYYNTNGLPQNPQPVKYQPYGGLGTNGTTPRYQVNSDFDFYSITLGLYQEWIELDTFYNIVATFSDEDFLAAGITPETADIFRFMASQETGHATLLTNLLGETAPKQCTYNYPYSTVREAVDFNIQLTRIGESGVWGFLSHLDSREVSQLLSQSIATEARQQMIFRQLLGQSPMPVWFESGIPQSWSWSLLAPYISSCPANNTRLIWQNFPALHVVNQANPNRFSPNDTADYEVVGRRALDPMVAPPQNESCVNVNATGYSCGPAITRNRTEPLTFVGKKIYLEWDAPGQAVGPNNSYVTSTGDLGVEPKYVLVASQLNATYADLTLTGNNTGYFFVPNATVYEGENFVNDTTFIALTGSNPYVTAFNLSNVNPYVNSLGILRAG